MNNQIFIILFWMLAFSCKAPVSSVYQDDVTLISAQKSEWFGGRPGIRGAMYTVILKPKNSKDYIKVKSFKAEGNTVPFTQTNSGNVVTVKGNFQITDKTDMPDYSPPGSSVKRPEKQSNTNPKENWIEYLINNSKRKYRIMIPKFNSIEPEGELIPRRP
ncbi:hypothetical protein [Chryseobacterium endophyticum]|uniref:Lipoprotein n=1 Tax=Chryseobacterium endophyticum TaxID=1854762 RepID=A0AAU6WNT7_9FLAO|nr:hypothetical protein [uncultured Chryseobacterium sp.]